MSDYCKRREGALSSCVRQTGSSKSKKARNPWLRRTRSGLRLTFCTAFCNLTLPSSLCPPTRRSHKYELVYGTSHITPSHLRENLVEHDQLLERFPLRLSLRLQTISTLPSRRPLALARSRRSSPPSPASPPDAVKNRRSRPRCSPDSRLRHTRRSAAAVSHAPPLAAIGVAFSALRLSARRQRCWARRRPFGRWVLPASPAGGPSQSPDPAPAPARANSGQPGLRRCVGRRWKTTTGGQGDLLGAQSCAWPKRERLKLV